MSERILDRLHRVTRDSSTITGYDGASSLDSGGLFTTPAQDGVISAVVGLYSGLERTLSVRESSIRDPQYQIVTGISQVNGTTGAECDVLPVAGRFTSAYINGFPMGDYGMASKVVKLSELGFRENDWTRADQRIIGSPLNGNTRNNGFPSGMGNQYSAIVRNTVAKVLTELALSSSLNYGQEFWYGDPAQDGLDGTTVKHMNGLDSMIKTGYVDAKTGELIPRADSIVTDFTGSTIEANGSLLTELIIEILAALDRRSMIMGFGMKWDGTLSMPEELFRKVAFMWPHKYYSYLTALNTTTEAQISAEALQNMRTSMLDNKVLITDTGVIPVVTDQALNTTDEGGGNYSGTIYFVPRTYQGEDATYVEYLPMQQEAHAAQAIREMMGEEKFSLRTSSDEGRFLLWSNTNDTCLQLKMKYRPRVRLDVPFLAARIDNVTYARTTDGNGNLINIYETPFPSSSDYLNGGAQMYSGARNTVRNVTACANNAAGVVDLTLDGKFDYTLNYVAYVNIGNTQIPAKMTAIDVTTPSAPVLTLDFTDATVTPNIFATVTCASLDFTSAKVTLPYTPQTV